MIVFLSDISWHALYQRPQHLAAGAARHEPVLWVEPATLGHPAAWEPVPVLPGLHRLTVPLFPHNARSRTIRAAAAAASLLPPARLAATAAQVRLVRRALRRLGAPQSGCRVLIQNFQLVRLARALEPSRILFDYIDDAFGFSALPRYVRALWDETVGAADAVVVTAERLRDQVAARRTGSVLVVRNGVEYERFAADASPRPADLPPAGTPVAGYIGSVYPWFDTGLLANAARRLPEVHFVLVGPTHPDVEARLEPLRRMANVHILGPRPYPAVPAYLRHFQAGIVPFLRTPLTEAVNPVKLYEYAAAGLPAVATLFADDLRTFGDAVHLAQTEDEFVTGLRRALEESGTPAVTERLRAFARRNDWTTRVDAVLSAFAAA